jgi:hypothetical protein
LRAAKNDRIAVSVRCGKFLVVAVLVLSTGAHWAALQSVAWTAMLANNLCCDSFPQAVCKTFDGAHPCCLCKAIAAAKKSEKKSEALARTLKMEFPPAAGKLNLFPPAQFEMLPLQNTFADSCSSKPPLPPPRGFFA